MLVAVFIKWWDERIVSFILTTKAAGKLEPSWLGILSQPTANLQTQVPSVLLLWRSTLPSPWLRLHLSRLRTNKSVTTITSSPGLHPYRSSILGACHIIELLGRKRIQWLFLNAVFWSISLSILSGVWGSMGKGTWPSSYTCPTSLLPDECGTIRSS